ncbi:MAG TPA: hypothetical protein VFR81_03610 [Longimicrobium sp.]|nr:hypothetical protein [Longimicrobium sp.]
MITLSIENLLVESFPTTENGGDAWNPSELGLEGCDQALFAPITAHTDPCDICCQQQ